MLSATNATPRDWTHHRGTRKRGSHLRIVFKMPIPQATPDILLAAIANLRFVIDMLNKGIAERDATIRALQARIDSDTQRIDLLSSNQRSLHDSLKHELVQLLQEREERMLGAVEDIHELVEGDPRLRMARPPTPPRESTTVKKRKVSFIEPSQCCMCIEEDSC